MGARELTKVGGDDAVGRWEDDGGNYIPKDSNLPAHFFVADKASLRQPPAPAEKIPKSKSVKDRFFFRWQLVVHKGSKKITMRVSNEWPFYGQGFKKFFTPTVNKNTKSFRLMWLYVTIGN